MKKAIILFSGGLDSSTLVALAHKEQYELYTLSFKYNQRHSVEIQKSQQFLKAYPIKERKIISIDSSLFQKSLLVSNTEEPPPPQNHLNKNIIPKTYVPARNTIFLSYALAWAETQHCTNIFIGVNHIDYSGYPDCRPEYIDAFSHLASLATKLSVEGEKIHIHAPLISMGKSQIIQLGHQLNVDYSLTHSCYFPHQSGLSCGQCDSCLLRKQGFATLNMKDPVEYQNSKNTVQ